MADIYRLRNWISLYGINNFSPAIHCTHTLQAEPHFEQAIKRFCWQGASLTNKLVIHFDHDGCMIMFLSKSYRLWLHALNDLIESHKKCNAIISCKTHKVTVVSFERHISSGSEAMPFKKNPFTPSLNVQWHVCYGETICYFNFSIWGWNSVMSPCTWNLYYMAELFCKTLFISQEFTSKNLSFCVNFLDHY